MNVFKNRTKILKIQRNAPVSYTHLDVYKRQHHTRAYVHHLLKSKEMLGMRLAVMHNLYFYNSFMEKIRTALDSGSFQAFYSETIHKVSRRI